MKNILLTIITIATVSSLNAQSGGWDGSATNGTTGYKDWGNGVIQLLDYNSTGCAGSAVHETTATYDPLSADFNQCYQVYFGCPGNDNIGSDAKGDGMAFSFWKSGLSYNINNGLACGGGLGYMGTVGAVDPNTKMISIEFDTWSSQGNFGFDAAFGGGASGVHDEIALHRGGDASDGGRLTSVNAGNLEDGLEHAVCINYNRTTHILTVSVDGNVKLTYDFTGSTYEFAAFFGAGGVNQSWSAGKFGATDQATVSNGASIFANVGGAFNLPTPAVADQTVCSGNSTTFDAGSGYNSYSWSTGATSQSISASSANTYTVTVINAAGCSGSASGILTVNPLPVVNVADQTICAGASTSFDAENAGATFAWTGPSGFNSTSQTPTVSVAGNYSVTVTKNGCSGNDNATLTLTTPAVNVADKTICAGTSTTLDAGNSGATYVWTGPNAFSSTSQTPTVADAGTYSVTVTVGSCSANDNALLTLTASPTVNVADKTICAGSSTTFDAGNVGATFVWTGPGAFSSTAQTPTVSAAGAYTVIVTQNSCSATDNATLSLNALPTVNVADKVICFGASTSFDAGNAGATFAWTGPSGFTSTSKTPSVALGGTYSVKVTDGNLCSSNDNAVLTVNAAIAPQLISDTVMCVGQSIELNPGTLPSLHYSWTPTLETTSKIYVSNAGKYKVIVSDDNNCKGSDSIVVQFTTPVNSNLHLGNDATICGNDINQLTLSVAYSPISKLHWSTLDSNVNSIVITKPGSYWVKVTDANKCSVADTINITPYCNDLLIDWPNVITTNDDNINDKFQPKGLDDSNFQNVIANINWISFEVYDRWGILMFSSGAGTLPNWDGKYNGSTAPSGTYYYVVKYKNSAEKLYEVANYMTVLN
ncbi:MAG: gliding motility-associated C-terminal domain-containing protein [Bacteroidetes bacterium]|nr:gliding motility-associated C-terminal domain-containing protein [Bacteroidota bacterium]